MSQRVRRRRHDVRMLQAAADRKRVRATGGVRQPRPPVVHRVWREHVRRAGPLLLLLLLLLLKEVRAATGRRRRCCCCRVMLLEPLLLLMMMLRWHNCSVRVRIAVKVRRRDVRRCHGGVHTVHSFTTAPVLLILRRVLGRV